MYIFLGLISKFNLGILLVLYSKHVVLFHGIGCFIVASSLKFYILGFGFGSSCFGVVFHNGGGV